MGYSTLLFLHVLGAFAMVAGVGLFVAILLAVGGSRTPWWRRGCFRPRTCSGRSAACRRLVFGIWLAIHVSQYSLTDGWILGAIVLWVIAAAIGGRISAGYKNLGERPVARRPERRRW